MGPRTMARIHTEYYITSPFFIQEIVFPNFGHSALSPPPSATSPDLTPILHLQPTLTKSKTCSPSLCLTKDYDVDVNQFLTVLPILLPLTKDHFLRWPLSCSHSKILMEVAFSAAALCDEKNSCPTLLWRSKIGEGEDEISQTGMEKLFAWNIVWLNILFHVGFSGDYRCSIYP